MLRDLALGLRQAAGVLSPEVQKFTLEEDSNIARAQQQLEMADELNKRKFEREQSTPEAQAQRDRLENDRLFRLEASAAGGDMVKIAAAAAKYGKPEIAVTIYNQQEGRKDAMERHKQNLEQKMTELTMRMEDRAASREQQAQYQQMMIGLRQQALALQGQIAAGNQDLQRLRIEMMGDKKQQEAERNKLKTTQQLGVAFEKANLPQMDAVVKLAETAVSDDKILEWVNGPKSSVPDFAAPKEVTDARQAIQKLFNITLKDRSGAAVTNQELERLKSEFGKGVFKKPEQLREAVTKARDIVNQHYLGIAAGFGKTALEDYNKNMREIGGSPVLLAPSSGGGWAIKPK